MSPSRAAWILAALAAGACDPGVQGHGPIAEGISAPLGAPIPAATAEQRATFERGIAVQARRFDRADGLGPSFNVTFCGACHEKPTPGGSAGMYRNFFLGGTRYDDGVFESPPESDGGLSNGVVRLYSHDRRYTARPEVPDTFNVVAQRNPIPFFGVGLIAELDEEDILANADPNDADGDGISGRPNYDRGFVGRFGVKAQTVSIEGFIRGPLLNHLGITTDPLTNAERSALPVDSSAPSDTFLGAAEVATSLHAFAQAAAPDGPLDDGDGVADPELSATDLFDLVSMTMLMAAPVFDTPTETTERGRDVFDATGCDGCHVPRLYSRKRSGNLPVYSDLLLHDMGPDLADGIVARESTGSEFRTQPLWGVTATGPYLHDGRAWTLDEAILWHGGEAQASRDAYDALSGQEQADLMAFLRSLGGRDQASQGLLPPDHVPPAVGAFGGPTKALPPEEAESFARGERLFDTEFGFSDGLGAPRLNGDSCRACHFEPVIGGAGPRGVNVVRHGVRGGDDAFTTPTVGTILHRATSLLTGNPNRPQDGADIFELRQTPHLFGIGLIDGIADETILAHADPEDADGDGISGKPSWTDDRRLGRFGWKADVDSLRAFVRDALSTELGMTLPYEADETFGRLQDNDDVPDPELGAAEIDQLDTYLRRLGPPPRQTPPDAELAARGETVFAEVGCADCHVPALQGSDGPVALYSDLLLHAVLHPLADGIETASATEHEFRTAPLWGISQTAPYLHDGRADTLHDAILGHDGEAALSKVRYSALSSDERAALIAFLETL